MPLIKRSAFPVIWFLVAIACLFSGAAASASDKRYDLPGNGSIEFTVPEHWGDSVRQPPGNLPPTITFQSADPLKFQALITPMWSANDQVPSISDADIKAHVASAADKATPSAVEQDLPLIAIVGSSGRGYYFSATDRAPKPGEYLYQTQGVMALEDLTVIFTILTNVGAGDAAVQALAMIQGARRIRP